MTKTLGVEKRAHLTPILLPALFSLSCGTNSVENGDGFVGSGGESSVASGGGPSVDKFMGGAPSTEPDKPKEESNVEAVEFHRLVLSQDFVAEGATFADFNNDGFDDVLAGGTIYAGPDFNQSYGYQPPSIFDPLGYSDNFFAFAHDYNDDGWLDAFIIGFPGEAGSWFENPGEQVGDWTEREVFPSIDNEAPTLIDLLGGPEPELVFNSEGAFGWADPLDTPATFHPISEDRGYQTFTHGLGVGDINGDGLMDVLAADGIWLQPDDLTGNPLWSFEAHTLGRGGAQIVTYDVDGDGDQDIITTLEAHGYGVAWFEQELIDGVRRFTEHLISGTPDTPGPTGIVLHEPHALTLADIDGDSLLDIVTGERFWGHVPEDPVFDAPAKLVYFKLVRDAQGAHFEEHIIDESSGVGTQVVARAINGETRASIVVANKKGVFVFRPSGLSSR